MSEKSPESMEERSRSQEPGDEVTEDLSQLLVNDTREEEVAGDEILGYYSSDEDVEGVRLALLKPILKKPVSPPTVNNDQPRKNVRFAALPQIRFFHKELSVESMGGSESDHLPKNLDEEAENSCGSVGGEENILDEDDGDEKNDERDKDKGEEEEEKAEKDSSDVATSSAILCEIAGDYTSAEEKNGGIQASEIVMAEEEAQNSSGSVAEDEDEDEGDGEEEKAQINSDDATTSSEMIGNKLVDAEVENILEEDQGGEKNDEGDKGEVEGDEEMAENNSDDATTSSGVILNDDDGGRAEEETGGVHTSEAVTVEEEVEERLQFPCTRCDRSFQFRSTLEFHFRVHTGERLKQEFITIGGYRRSGVSFVDDGNVINGSERPAPAKRRRVVEISEGPFVYFVAVYEDLETEASSPEVDTEQAPPVLVEVDESDPEPQMLETAITTRQLRSGKARKASGQDLIPVTVEDKDSSDAFKAPMETRMTRSAIAKRLKQ